MSGESLEQGKAQTIGCRDSKRAGYPAAEILYRVLAQTQPEPRLQPRLFRFSDCYLKLIRFFGSSVPGGALLPGLADARVKQRLEAGIESEALSEILLRLVIAPEQQMHQAAMCK